MQPRCTCGAVLPDDARFCHKCGKPQFEEDAARIDAESAKEAVPASLEPSTLSSAPPVGISFKNSRAVVISLVVAASAVVGFLPIIFLAPPSLFPIFLLAVGFAAVRIYKGRSPEALSTSAGARLGWMTGLWIFLVYSVLLAVAAVAAASPEIWKQWQSARSRLPQTATASNLSQHEFMMQLLIAFPFFFFLFTFLPGLGGILGAKFSLRKRAS